MHTPNGAQSDDHGSGQTAKRVFFWLGVAGVSAAVTFFLIRATMRRAPIDPTTQRIESLIDEANRLLKALEEQK